MLSDSTFTVIKNEISHYVRNKVVTIKNTWKIYVSLYGDAQSCPLLTNQNQNKNNFYDLKSTAFKIVFKNYQNQQHSYSTIIINAD